MNGQDSEQNPETVESRTTVLNMPVDSSQPDSAISHNSFWKSNGRVPEIGSLDSNGDDAIISASSFFFDNNDNYKVSWNEVNERIAEIYEDPSRPPVPGCNKDFVQWRLRRIIESIWFRALTMFLITFDICIVIADLVISNSDSANAASTSYALEIVDFVITVYFALELTTRIVVLTPSVFFKAWYNMVDFAVVTITFVCVCVARAGSEDEWASKLTILTVLRFVRIARLIRLCTERKQLETAARQLISQNKRRYQVDGYDLDLTYITKRVIATSFPSSGLVALYRNPIRHLANFLNDKHGGKYKIYNLCSERTYDESFFKGAKVERFRIDDHNVPTLEEMFQFVENVANWLGQDPENVIVVHCKGGKGRTGTMICIWLIEKGIFSSAGESLDYFGNRRTDTNVSSKFQGVETPSQARYVGYFEEIKKSGGIFPEPRSLTISEIKIKGMMYLGKGDGSDFWLDINEGCGPGSHQFSAHIGFNRNCNQVYDPHADLLTIKLVNCPSLEGDVRILFQTDNQAVPKGYENAPFYFWFNTRMIQGNSLILNRSQLDNPHKEKTWKYFREQFRVEVIFS